MRLEDATGSVYNKIARFDGFKKSAQRPEEQPIAANIPIESGIPYVKHDYQRKCSNDATKKNNRVHSITSLEQEEALDIIRWTFAVAKLPADSPRFAWYVSRWAVPEKIARAKAAGTFDNSIRNCPPIDPAWIRLVPAALEECSRFAESIKPPAKRASSPEKQTPRSHYLMAYLNSPVLPALTLMRSTPVPSAMRASTVSAISGNRVPLRM